MHWRFFKQGARIDSTLRHSHTPFISVPISHQRHVAELLFSNLFQWNELGTRGKQQYNVPLILVDAQNYLGLERR